MEQAKPRIISLGEVLWDVFPEGARFGGAPANFACHATLQGAEVAMVSAVGNDPRGREAIDILRRHGVDVSLLQTTSQASTGIVNVRLDANGKPTFRIEEDSAWDSIAWTSDVEAKLAEASAVYFGTLGQRGEISRSTIRRVLAAAKASGLVRILDVNLRAPYYDDVLLRESVELASVLKLSDEELAEVCSACDIDSSTSAETAMRNLLDQHHLDLVVMTRGAEGALLVSSSETISQPGIPTQVQDTVGAGDSFTATLATGLLKGESPENILRQACEIAAAVCAHVGAVPEPPDCS